MIEFFMGIRIAFSPSTGLINAVREKDIEVFHQD